MAVAAVHFACVAAFFVALDVVQATIYDVSDSDGLGRKFDGIGGLSGGGVIPTVIVTSRVSYSSFFSSRIHSTRTDNSLLVFPAQY